MTDPNRIVVVEGVTSSFIATDTFSVDGATQHFQYVKLAWGPDDTVNLVDSATGKHIPVQLYAGGSAITTTSNALDVNIGSSSITVATTPSGGTLDSVTIVGGTLDGVTIVGGTIDNISSATVSGGTLDSVTIVGGTIDTISSATVVGGTLDSVFVTGATVGNVTTVTNVSGATVLGGTIDTISSVTAVLGGTIDTISTITNGVTVTATDLDIRGLSLGTIGFSGNTLSTTTDSVVVQGVSGAFPVTTLLSGASAQGVASNPIGSSGDALKVSVVGAEIAATVNVGTEVAVFSNGTHLQVSGSSAGASDAHPIIVGGCAAAGAIPVALHGLCGGATLGAVTVSSGTVTATVSATDLDIRGLSFGVAGYTGPAASTADSVVIQGVSAMYPVHNVLYGFCADAESVALGVTYDAGEPILRTSLDPRFATSANALQIQGRADGITINPVAIVGITGPDQNNPLIGVTFSSLATETVVGGSSQDTLKTFLHGLSSGTTVMPVGVSGDALKVFMEDINVNASIESTSISVSNTDLAVKGAAAGTNGVFVTGTAGSASQWPVFVSGFKVDSTIAGGITFAPVGVTYEHFNELEGLSGGITSINNILFGMCAGIDGVTTGLFDHIDTIHDQTSFTNIEEALGKKTSSQDNMVTALDDLHTIFVDDPDATTPTAATIPVSVAAPTGLITAKKTAQIGTAQSISTNTDTLNSGVRVKLPSSAGTANVFVGGSGVNSTNGYLLEPGDDVFIEIKAMNLVFVVAETTAVDVYAIGS